MVSFNPCVEVSPRTKTFFFLLSICTDELLSTLKVITFLPLSKPGYEKNEQQSNTISYP